MGRRPSCILAQGSRQSWAVARFRQPREIPTSQHAFAGRSEGSRCSAVAQGMGLSSAIRPCQGPAPGVGLRGALSPGAAATAGGACECLSDGLFRRASPCSLPPCALPNIACPACAGRMTRPDGEQRLRPPACFLPGGSPAAARAAFSERCLPPATPPDRPLSRAGAFRPERLVAANGLTSNQAATFPQVAPASCSTASRGQHRNAARLTPCGWGCRSPASRQSGPARRLPGADGSPRR